MSNISFSNGFVPTKCY